MEAQLNQAEQHFSEQIREECQAIQLRSGRTLNNQPQNSKKQGEEEMEEDEQAATQSTIKGTERPEGSNSGVEH
ncbi:hypothetical protein AHAS_Ahas20G0263600 [Arachis hypogaea]